MTLPTATTPLSDTRLDHLELSNFRSFTKFTIDFHPQMTVLVAPNGGGKTSVLDGVVVAMRLLVDGMLGEKASKGFNRSDIHLVRGPNGDMQPQPPTDLFATGMLGGIPATWTRVLASAGPHARTTYADAAALQNAANTLRKEVFASMDGGMAPPILPLVAYYGTGRLWNLGRVSDKKREEGLGANERFAAYRDSLSATSNYRVFADWFWRVSYDSYEASSRAPSGPNLPGQQIAAVRQAVDTVLAPVDWSTLEFHAAAQELVLYNRKKDRFPASLLSDGVRNMMAMVADIAHRCARLNPHFLREAAGKTPGIVLIDEVDMHLHPEWQQLVLDSLRDAFPCIQFIVTTHSPHVLTTVDNSQIRILSSDGTVTTPGTQTRGWESGSVLAEVMGVDPRPTTREARLVSEFLRLVAEQLDESPEANGKLEEIISHYGPYHPIVLDCQRSARFASFRRKREGAKESGTP